MRPAFTLLALALLLAECAVAEESPASAEVPSQCAYASEDGGNVWTFTNTCTFAVEWTVQCLVHDRFCGTNFVVRVGPKSSRSGYIHPPVEINGPYF